MTPGVEDQTEGRHYSTSKRRELLAQHHNVYIGEELSLQRHC
jgi:hypothetical protein